MSVSAETAVAALNRIFVSVAPSGRSHIEARALHRLWMATGMRRADLATALKVMIDAGRIRAEHKSGGCLYGLVKHAALSSTDTEQKITNERELENLASRAMNGTQLPQIDRRRSLAPTIQADSERRRAQKSRLLAILPAACYEALNRQLDFVSLPRGLVLWRRGEIMRYAYFPVDCIVSMMIEMNDGAPCEIAMIGNEGMIDVSSVLGTTVAGRQAQVAAAGFAYRIAVSALRTILDENEAARHLLMRYASALINEISQTAACNRHHSVDQRLSRLLLSTRDRTRSPHLALTHETLSNMLGVRREGVTHAMGRLRAAGLIDGERGVVMVGDPQGLVKKSCECYQAIRREYNKLRVTRPHGTGAPGARQNGVERAALPLFVDTESPGLMGG